MTREKIKIVGINARFTHSSLALFYVRNELEKNCLNMEGELCQYTINDNYYEMLLRLSAGGPRYIFFSAAIWNSTLVEKLTGDLRRCLPLCRVVIGGPQAAVLGDRLGPDNCTVVTGEIEGVGSSFYRDLQEGRLLPRYTGSFFAMEKRDFGYPYRPSDFSEWLMNRHIYYESSKGCPFSCTYCLSSAEKRIYHKDLATVKKELRDILGYRPKVLRFIDRTFNDNTDRALAIWQFLAEEGGSTLFHFEMAPDRFTEEMFGFLSTLSPGRFQFEMGIQSTNGETLEAVNRRVDSAKAEVAITRLAALANIHLHVDLILGLPFETKETFARSFCTVFSMGAHYIQMGLLKILPDTPIRLQVAEYGYRFCSEPPYAVLQNRWIDHQGLSELYWFCEAVEKFHNNRYFPTLWQYLRHRREDGFAFFRQLLDLCLQRGFFQLAATQELLCSLLVQLTEQRQDGPIIVELLRYDWLRCGFRFLPDCLQKQGFAERPEQTRSTLYQLLPEELPGIFDRSSRNQFFRKSYFLRMSPEAFAETGLTPTSERYCLGILADRQDGLFSYCRVLVF